MNKIIGFFFLTIAAITSYAQQPAPDPDTVTNPVKQIDPEVKQTPADIHYVDEMTRIAATELPQVVLDSLKKREPNTWEKSIVYHDKRSNAYIVEVRDGGREKIYKFDPTGRPSRAAVRKQH